MAKIKNITAYPTVTPSVSDLIIGTDVNDGNKTVTFLVGALGGGVAINQDLDSVLGVGNTSLLNIELNGNASALGSSITVIDIFPTTISAGGLGSHGVAGQVLSSTGTGLAWINSPGLNQSWDDTLNVSPVATANPNLTGVFTIQTGGGLNVLGTSQSNFQGNSYFFSSSKWSPGSNLDVSATSQIIIAGAPGTTGQFLSLTPTGMRWTSNGTLNVPTLQQVVTSGNTLLNSSILFTGTGGVSLSSTNTITGQGNITLNGNGTGTTNSTTGKISIASGSFNLNGPNTPIILFGNSGTAGQALVSNGPFITPTWQTVAGSNQNLQQVLDVGNAATQTINLTGAVNLLGATGELNLGATSFITLNADRGLAGQVLISGGALGFPTWSSVGTGVLTAVTMTDTAYIDSTVDLTIPSQPDLKSALIVNGSSGGLNTNYYDASGAFSVPKGNDWDLTVSNVGSLMTITNSDGTNSSSFTLQGSGGAVFNNAGGNNIELAFSGSGTGTVQSISLTDSTGTIGTPITNSGSFTFTEQAASSTYLRTTSAASGLGITLSTETPTIQVVAAVGSTLLNKALTIQNGNGTTNNAFVLGTSATPSVATAGQVLAFNSASGGYMEWVAQTGGGNMSSWVLAGDSVQAAITNGVTATIAGGTGITSTLNGITKVLTIDNTGVTSIVAGTNVTISGGTGAVTINSSVPAGTGTVTSVGIVADNGNGTGITTNGEFTFTGGTNVTTNVVGNTVTINAAAAAGVATFTATSGAFINFTPVTSQTGTVTLTGDLSATGSPSPTTFLRGDNTWAVPPDTTYNVFTGATNAPADGTSGLVPQPLASTLDYNKFLKGDGTWATPAGAGTLTAITAALPITVDLVTDPAIPALDINDFSGATSLANGLKGTVPAPLIANEIQFLQGTGNWVTPPTYVGAVATVSAGVVGYVPSATNAQNLHFLRGDGTWVIPTDTNDVYSADSTTLTLSGSQFSITTGDAANLTLGVSTTQLAGAPGTGTVNQLLESDGLGGFAWVTGAASGVSLLNGLSGALTVSGTGDTVVGQNGVGTIGMVSGSIGAGYIVGQIYPTNKLASVNPNATGVVVKVIAVDGIGGILTLQLLANGKNWTANDTFTVKYGTTLAQCEVVSVQSATTISASSWNGISGIAKSTAQGPDYVTRTFSTFEGATDLYSSVGLKEQVPSGTGNQTTPFITIGNPIVGIRNRINIAVAGDIGYISDTQLPNIQIGSKMGNDYSNVIDTISIGNGGALRDITTGSANIGLGSGTGMLITTGTGNVLIGKNAVGQTTGLGKVMSRNVIVGQSAGQNANSNQDVFIGFGAGQSAVNNTNDPTVTFIGGRIAIGSLAMAGINPGLVRRYNVGEIAIGQFASSVQPTTNASSSGGGVYIGLEAGRGIIGKESTADSGWHVAIGYGAMGQSGGSARKGQIAIGYNSSFGNANTNIDTYNTSIYGIAIGVEAEGQTTTYGSITRSGSGNIAIGHRAAGLLNGVIQGNTIALGSSAMAEGAETIAVGRLAKAGGAAQAGSIAIGFQAEAQFNNSVAIGRSATSTDANQFVVGSSTYPVGTVIVAPPATTTTTWTVKINGTDYKIPMYAA